MTNADKDTNSKKKGLEKVTARDIVAALLFLLV
jgi:hypothetical protein